MELQLLVSHNPDCYAISTFYNLSLFKSPINDLNIYVQEFASQQLSPKDWYCVLQRYQNMMSFESEKE
jgi:hypothetical protein